MKLCLQEKFQTSTFSQTPKVPYQSAVFEKAAKSGHGFQFPNCVSFGLSLFQSVLYFRKLLIAMIRNKNTCGFKV